MTKSRRLGPQAVLSIGYGPCAGGHKPRMLGKRSPRPAASTQVPLMHTMPRVIAYLKCLWKQGSEGAERRVIILSPPPPSGTDKTPLAGRKIRRKGLKDGPKMEKRMHARFSVRTGYSPTNPNHQTVKTGPVRIPDFFSAGNPSLSLRPRPPCSNSSLLHRCHLAASILPTYLLG